MFHPDWLILRILHQSFEKKGPKAIGQRSWYIYIRGYSDCDVIHEVCFGTKFKLSVDSLGIYPNVTVINDLWNRRC